MENRDNDRVLITNIQRFSLHDGPGIRSTVFFKGCSVHCPWCCNPECIKSEPEQYETHGNQHTYGKWYSNEELYKDLIKDCSFYGGDLERDEWNIDNYIQLKRLPGGITFSGGEALIQIKKIKPMLGRFNKEGIHTVIETSLFADSESVEFALEYIDFFYVDMKIADSESCRKTVGGDWKQYEDNLKKVLSWRSNDGRKKPVVIRIPVIGGYTDKKENRDNIISTLKEYSDEGIRPVKIELLEGHNISDNKYKTLGICKPEIVSVDKSLMRDYTEKLTKIGFYVGICKI